MLPFCSILRFSTEQCIGESSLWKDSLTGHSAHGVLRALVQRRVLWRGKVQNGNCEAFQVRKGELQQWKSYSASTVGCARAGGDGKSRTGGHKNRSTNPEPGGLPLRRSWGDSSQGSLVLAQDSADRSSSEKPSRTQHSGLLWLLWTHKTPKMTPLQHSARFTAILGFPGWLLPYTLRSVREGVRSLLPVPGTEQVFTQMMK